MTLCKFCDQLDHQIQTLGYQELWKILFNAQCVRQIIIIYIYALKHIDQAVHDLSLQMLVSSYETKKLSKHMFERLLDSLIEVDKVQPLEKEKLKQNRSWFSDEYLEKGLLFQG